jgi:hypothetical protein
MFCCHIFYNNFISKYIFYNNFISKYIFYNNFISKYILQKIIIKKLGRGRRYITKRLENQRETNPEGMWGKVNSEK